VRPVSIEQCVEGWLEVRTDITTMRQAFTMVLLLRMLPRSADEEDDDYDYDYDGVGGGRMTIVLVENDDDDEEVDGTRHRRGQMNFLKNRTGPVNRQMPVSICWDDVRCDTRPSTSNKTIDRETYQPVVVAGTQRSLPSAAFRCADTTVPLTSCRSIPVRTSDDDDGAATVRRFASSHPSLKLSPRPNVLTHGRSSIRLLVRRPIGSQVAGCLSCLFHHMEAAVPRPPYGSAPLDEAYRCGFVRAGRKRDGHEPLDDLPVVDDGLLDGGEEEVHLEEDDDAGDDDRKRQRAKAYTCGYQAALPRPAQRSRRRGAGWAALLAGMRTRG
jgi:hypothetical protein